MKYTILHISDLHKGKNADLHNLFASLERDCTLYQKEGIQKPSLIVVSGDVVNGAEGDNAIEEIKRQYEEVTVFLDKLVSYFLDGEKRRMIIVPGNHDVCREISKSSMRPSLASKADDLKNYWNCQSDIRWSWKEYQFYKIFDQTVYESRFRLFVDSYNSRNG